MTVLLTISCDCGVVVSIRCATLHTQVIEGFQTRTSDCFVSWSENVNEFTIYKIEKIFPWKKKKNKNGLDQ
jgi:hypothetical protein